MMQTQQIKRLPVCHLCVECCQTAQTQQDRQNGGMFAGKSDIK